MSLCEWLRVVGWVWVGVEVLSYFFSFFFFFFFDFLFCTVRVGRKNSAQGAARRTTTKLPSLLTKIETCLSHPGNVQDRHRQQSQILIEANSMVEQCRRVLQWIYVAAYYFPRESMHYPLFKSNHDSLEGHTEHLNRVVSFGAQVNGTEMSWDAIIQVAGSSALADVLRELSLETDRCGSFLESFMKATEFELYFREAKRDTDKLPKDANK